MERGFVKGKDDAGIYCVLYKQNQQHKEFTQIQKCKTTFPFSCCTIYLLRQREEAEEERKKTDGSFLCMYGNDPM